MARKIFFSASAVRNYEGGLEVIYNSTLFGEQTAYYRLPNILSQYGKPDSVLIKTYSLKPGRADFAFFYIALLYPEQGIFVQYVPIHSGHVSDNKFLGCPANAPVTLDLYPSGNSDYFWEQMAEKRQWVLDTYKPLEEVTSMSIDEFYETFRVPTDACVETSSRIWPSGD